MPKKDLVAALPKMGKELSEQYSPEEFAKLLDKVRELFGEAFDNFSQQVVIIPRAMGKVLAQRLAIMIGDTVRGGDGESPVCSNTKMPDGREFSEWEKDLKELQERRKGTRGSSLLRHTSGVANSRELNELMKILRIAEIHWGEDLSSNCLIFKIRREAFADPSGITAADVKRVDPDEETGVMPTMINCRSHVQVSHPDIIIADDPVNPVSASKRYQTRTKELAKELNETLFDTGAHAKKFRKVVREVKAGKRRGPKRVKKRKR